MPTTPPTNTPAPELPIRHVKATFSDRVDAFVTWFVSAMGQAYALALNCFNNAKEAYDSAVAAANWAGLASDKAAAAAGSANGAAESMLAAAAINNAAMWASGTTYQQYQVAVSRITLKTYRKSTTAATSTGGVTDPANDPANWQVMGAAMPRAGRTANTMLIARDMGAFIDITSGDFTQTFETPSNLGADWYCFVKNSGDGNITIPASDGRTNWIMYSGETRLFQCDGTSLRSVVIQPFAKAFTASGTFVKPPGYRRLAGEMWNGGVGGRSGDGPSYYMQGGGAGGRGGYAGRFEVDAISIPNSLAVTVGAGSIGGAPSTVISNGPSTPGTSSFGDYASVSQSILPTLDGGEGGKGFGEVNGIATPATPGTAPKLSGKGGDGATAANQPGANGTAPGGGGGGGGASFVEGVPSGKGGDGARGEVRVWGIA